MKGENSFADHFSTQAVGYSQYRPVYPAAMFDYLATLCPQHEFAWDCATGSGQAATELAVRYAYVFASDASYAQLSNAAPGKNIFYLTSLAEQTPFADHCLDLITVAQALHWFRLDGFYDEVRRILKPGGVIAVWTYNLMQVNPAIDTLIRHLYADILGEYWPFERRLVENGYRDLAFPFEVLTPPPFAMRSRWSLSHLYGYLSTWSAVKRYQEQRGADPLKPLMPRLQQAWGESETHIISWPLSLRIGQV